MIIFHRSITIHVLFILEQRDRSPDTDHHKQQIKHGLNKKRSEKTGNTDLHKLAENFEKLQCTFQS